MRIVLLSALALVLTACPVEQATPPPADPAPPPASPHVPSHELDPPPEADGATAWAVTVPPEEYDEEARFDSPQAVLDELERLQAERELDGAEPEVSSELIEEEEDVALGRVVIGGVPDDAIYGDELLVEMTRDDEGWHITEMWTRVLCRRGVDADTCL